jgi:hypothetical protein
VGKGLWPFPAPIVPALAALVISWTELGEEYLKCWPTPTIGTDNVADLARMSLSTLLAAPPKRRAEGVAERYLHQWIPSEDTP